MEGTLLFLTILMFVATLKLLMYWLTLRDIKSPDASRVLSILLMCASCSIVVLNLYLKALGA